MRMVYNSHTNRPTGLQPHGFCLWQDYGGTKNWDHHRLSFLIPATDFTFPAGEAAFQSAVEAHGGTALWNEVVAYFPTVSSGKRRFYNADGGTGHDYDYIEPNMQTLQLIASEGSLTPTILDNVEALAVLWNMAGNDADRGGYSSGSFAHGVACRANSGHGAFIFGQSNAAGWV